MGEPFRLGRDKGKRRAYWYFNYVDEYGKRRMKKGFTDKALTRQLAEKLEFEGRQRRLGLIDTKQEKLAKAQQSSIEPHLVEYEKSLRAKENSDKHIKLTMSRIRKIVAGCEFNTLDDLNSDDVETFLTELREEDEIGFKTYNHYLQAIDGWGNWMVSRRRFDRNPIAGIPRLNAELDVRHPRRALTPVEFGKLLASAHSSGVNIQCYSGELRARIYTLSYMTGLRKGEMASLTPKSFQLEQEQPTVTVEAKSSKHRKKDVLPLHPDLIPMVTEWIKGVQPNEPLFEKLGRRKTWLMVKKDLERAGVPYQTDEGIADFHAAGRHTHITELLRNGATLPEARELARHSDVRMTMRYTHISLDDQARALSSLPAPCQHIVSRSDVPNGHRVTQTDDGDDTKRVSDDDENPCRSKGYDAASQPKSTADNESQKWRRRGSNPNTTSRNILAAQGVTNSEDSSSGNCQEIDGTTWLDLASVDAELWHVIECWNFLSREEKQRIADVLQR